MKSIRQIGYWSAISSLVLAFGYIVPQIFSTLKLIPHPQDEFWLFAPSLPLAPAFMITMICLHHSVDKSIRIWTAIAVAFAIIYTVCCTNVYFIQLSVVLPQLSRAEISEDHVLAFKPGSFLMGVDCLGYFFMSLSTFFAAFAFTHNEQHKWLYRGLLYNGLLLPILILAFFYPGFYYIGAIWMISFPLAMINAARYFSNDLRNQVNLKKEQ
ncbi:MAG: hypothetical protein ACHQET_00835 [Chitinophagales bacterium]